MSLMWIRTPSEILVGTADNLVSDDHSSGLKLENPMTLRYVQMQNPSKLHGQKPQMVTGFHLDVIPCSEIFIHEVSYAGMINPNDAVYVTYYKILEAVKEQRESPLMVPQ